jgi:hypothetical protein
MTKADLKKSFGATVRGHRPRLAISQETLAERAELPRTYVTDAPWSRCVYCEATGFRSLEFHHPAIELLLDAAELARRRLCTSEGRP